MSEPRYPDIDLEENVINVITGLGNMCGFFSDNSIITDKLPIMPLGFLFRSGRSCQMGKNVQVYCVAEGIHGGSFNTKEVLDTENFETWGF